jgi:hypothetical protein
MHCYQVVARLMFHRHKPVLVSTEIKKQDAPAFLVSSGLPYGSCVRLYRYFRSKKEAEDYVSHLNKVYIGRTISDPAISGGQGWLF